MPNTLKTKVGPWKAETREARLERCRVFLFHHGMISEDEAEALRRKI